MRFVNNLLINIKINAGTLKVISSILSNLAAGWIGSILILPGIFKINSTEEIVSLLTYSILFATLAIYLASKIENKLI